MIQKIRNEEYLKRLSNMTLAEKNEYTARVGEWLKRKAPLLAKKMEQQEASYQNPLQMGMMWNDAECRAWHEGVTLMSALMSTADTWLPDMIYVKAAKRGIRQMIRVLKGCIAEQPATMSSRLSAAHGEISPQGRDDKAVESKGEKAEPKGEQVSKGEGENKPQTSNLKPQTQGNAQAVPTRPKHIDQYVHLLPKKTQDRAALVRQLLRDLDAARENARMLAVAGEHPDKIAAWAKTATNLDNKLHSIYQELDNEWEKLVQNGCVGVDAFGNAFVTEKGQAELNVPTPADGHPSPTGAGSTKRGRKPMTEEEKAAAAEKRSAAREARQKENDAKRLEALKKNLRDTRTNATPERKKQWKDNLKVLLALGGKITDSIRKAAEHYGIELKEYEHKDSEAQSNAKDK